MLRIFAIYAKKTETWIFHGYMVQKQKKIFNTVLRDLKGFGIWRTTSPMTLPFVVYVYFR